MPILVGNVFNDIGISISIQISVSVSGEVQDSAFCGSNPTIQYSITKLLVVLIDTIRINGNSEC